MIVLDEKISKELQEAGITEKSDKCWFIGEQESWLAPSWSVFPGITDKYYAFTLEELLDMVEGDYKFLATSPAEIGKWDFACRKDNKKGTMFTFKDPKHAVAMGILWQKGEGR